ncbi:MAG: Asp-tRNA(Asn)/Glu-tRNA(Gln) amidotransferase subunit GatC [Candidatus Omnitrophica bacterium]|nr:Asp-tRNA(Asn)/Glu-tRNA(Gln) amidotransferase subunit GatC [Candidatus Omnitrophota bacterium]
MKKNIDVDYIANLARIKLEKKESSDFSSQLGDIISFVEKLNKVDTKDTPPTTHPLPLMNVFREDKVKESLPAEKALSNAPDKKYSFFKVPKVIEEA